MNGSKRVGQFHWPCIALVGALTMILGPVSAANGPPELVFVNGKPAERSVGFRPNLKEDLREKLQALL